MIQCIQILLLYEHDGTIVTKMAVSNVISLQVRCKIKLMKEVLRGYAFSISQKSLTYFWWLFETF